MSADGLTMHWMSSRTGGAGGNDIWRAQRNDRTMPWGVQTTVSALNTPSLEAGGSISDDGLMIVFVSDRAGAVMGDDLYYATRGTPMVPWGVANRFTELATTGYEGDPWVSRDGRHMFFTRLAGGLKTIWEASR